MTKNKLFLGVLVAFILGGPFMYGAASSGPSSEEGGQKRMNDLLVEEAISAFKAASSQEEKIESLKSLTAFLVKNAKKEAINEELALRLGSIITHEHPLIAWLLNMQDEEKLSILKKYFEIAHPKPFPVPAEVKGIEASSLNDARFIVLEDFMEEEFMDARLPHIINNGPPIYFRVKGIGERGLKLLRGSLPSLPGFEGIYKLDRNQSVTLPLADIEAPLRLRVWPAFIEGLSENYLGTDASDRIRQLDRIAYRGMLIQGAHTLIVSDSSHVNKVLLDDARWRRYDVDPTSPREMTHGDIESFTNAAFDFEQHNPDHGKVSAQNIFITVVFQKKGFHIRHLKRDLVPGSRPITMYVTRQR